MKKPKKKITKLSGIKGLANLNFKILTKEELEKSRNSAYKYLIP